MDATTSHSPRVEVSARSSSRLRALNLVAGVVHLAQGAAILVLANDFALPVTAAFLDDAPQRLAGAPAPEVLFDLRYAPVIAAFLFLAAADHLLVGGPLRSRYELKLGAGINPYRWVEYCFSATAMIVLIAMLAGVLDVAALVAICTANVTMILCGLVMERTQVPGRADWLPFWVGCVAGAAPWVAIAIYLFGPGQVPGFVYGIFFSLFVLFNCFAINMALQYRRVGPWRDYLVGERGYIVLSLTAKSALAWQVFAGTLA